MRAAVRILTCVVLAAAAARGATLAPAAASDYKYVVPPVEYFPLVNDEGMGDTVSYRRIRYTDVAWLSNALGEFDKMAREVLAWPRVWSNPCYQKTNTLMRVLYNPTSRMGVNLYYQYQYDVNYGPSAQYPLPDYLDENHDISASASLPVTGYDGSVNAAWPYIAGVSVSDGWSLTNMLAVLKANSQNRVLTLSSITNAYASVKKLHSLKKVLTYSTSGLDMGSQGWTNVTDGLDISHEANWNANGQRWIETTLTNAIFYGQIPQWIGEPGNFEFVRYWYVSKSYDTALTATNALTISPMEKLTQDFKIYKVAGIVSARPKTKLLRDTVEKVYVEDPDGYAEEVGDDDLTWSERIGAFRRVSCFSVRWWSEERLAATGPTGRGAITNSTSTTYVLADTTQTAAENVAISATAQYLGQYNIIARCLVPLGGEADLLGGMIKGVGGECQDPRYPQVVGNQPDYLDSTYRKIVVKASHVWTISTLRPNYTCTFDGN